MPGSVCIDIIKPRVVTVEDSIVVNGALISLISAEISQAQVLEGSELLDLSLKGQIKTELLYRGGSSSNIFL